VTVAYFVVDYAATIFYGMDHMMFEHGIEYAEYARFLDGVKSDLKIWQAQWAFAV